MNLPDRYLRIMHLLQAKGLTTHCRDLLRITVANSMYRDGELTCYHRMLNISPEETEKWTVLMAGSTGHCDSPSFSEDEILEIVPYILSSDTIYEEYRRRWIKPLQ